MLTFIIELKQRNPVLFYNVAVYTLLAILCLALALTTKTQVQGANVWYKPFKFCVSSAILISSVAWYMHYLQRPNFTAVVTWGFVLLFFIENAYIIIQAARGQMSHFNVGTPFYSAMFSVMALSAIGITLLTLAVGLLFFSSDFKFLPSYYVWAIRLGTIIFAVYALQGLVMGSRLSHTVGAPDGGPGLPVVNWSTRFGDLRIAHFLGMHALQIIPLLAYYVVRNNKGVIILAIAYTAVTTFIFVQALNGKPPVKIGTAIQT
jgi:hypothetical protein